MMDHKCKASSIGDDTFEKSAGRAVLSTMIVLILSLGNLMISAGSAYAVRDVPMTGRESGDRLFRICLMRSDSEHWDLGSHTACCSHRAKACIVCEKGQEGDTEPCFVIPHGERSGPPNPNRFEDVVDGTSNTVIEPSDPPFDPFMQDEVFDPGTTIVVPNNVRATFDQCRAADDHRLRVSFPYSQRVQCCSAELDYCFQCRQDGTGLCTKSPFSHQWPERIDGHIQTTRPSNNEDRPSVNTGTDDDDDPIIID